MAASGAVNAVSAVTGAVTLAGVALIVLNPKLVLTIPATTLAVNEPDTKLELT
jgi:hypothetical protein